MAEWTLPAELDQPLPRTVRMRGSFGLLLLIQIAIFAGLMIWFGAMIGSTFYKAQVLKERGVPVAGTITRLYTSNGGKGSTNYNMDYAYPLLSPTPHAATGRIDFRHFYTLRVRDVVPVVYDPEYPSRSEPNFDGVVFARDNLRVLEVQSFALAPVLLILLIGSLVLVPAYRRQKRLLQCGRAAAATIVSDTEYYAGRAGMKSAVAYTFTDASGQAIRGKRMGLPRRGSRRDAMYTEMFGDPTVIYDPDDSAKNMLYPFAFVDCPPKPEQSVFSAG